MAKTLGIVCTINPLGESLKKSFLKSTTYRSIIVANPNQDDKFSYGLNHYLVHLGDMKEAQMTAMLDYLSSRNPQPVIDVFSGTITQREACKRYDNVTVHDTAPGAWQACERRAAPESPLETN